MPADRVLQKRIAHPLTRLVGRPPKHVRRNSSTAEQRIGEGKNAIKWTRLRCQKFRTNEVRLQLHALAYNPGIFMRTLALPRAMGHRSLSTLGKKLIKIGAKFVSQDRYVSFQMAEVAVS